MFVLRNCSDLFDLISFGMICLVCFVWLLLLCTSMPYVKPIVLSDFLVTKALGHE